MIAFLVPFVVVILALALLVAEDLLPTGGAFGILAMCCLGFLLYLGFSESMSAGLWNLGFELVFVPSGFWAWSYVLSRTGLGRIGSLRPPDAHEVDASLEGPDLGRLVGLRGRALTTLRPSGMVDFDGRRLDGLAEEGLIPPGSPILAVQVRSRCLVVRLLSEDLRSSSPGRIDGIDLQ